MFAAQLKVTGIDSIQQLEHSTKTRIKRRAKLSRKLQHKRNKYQEQCVYQFKVASQDRKLSKLFSDVNMLEDGLQEVRALH